MTKRVRKVFVFAPLVIALILGGLLLLDWGVVRGKSDLVCRTLAKDDPTLERSKIVATGKFKTHNESFIFIGEIVEFEIRVVYDHDRVEVKDRSIRNLNLSPYKVLSQGDVVTRKHAGCSEKTMHFTLQALDVDPGSKNRFEYLNPEGLSRYPEIEYAGEGLVRTISPDYEAPYVVTVTDGTISRVSDNAKKYPLPQEERVEKTWQDTARFYLGIMIALWLVSWIGLTLLLRKTKRAVELEKSADLIDLFPELFGDGDIHERLTRAYFRLEKILDPSLKDKVSRVFSRDLTPEQKEVLILELREFVEGRYRNDELA